MAQIRKSVVLPNCFPQTVYSQTAMMETLPYLAERGIDLVELYCEGLDLQAVRKALEKCGLRSYYVAIVPLKGKGLSLCSLDEENRKAAVRLTMQCIDCAHELGSERIMINSGAIPEHEEQIPQACDAFLESLQQLQQYINSKGYSAMEFSLEPCDSAMQAKNLLGSTWRTVEICRRAEELGIPLLLAMDTAHILEEGEDIAEALRDSEPYCDHVHFANCVLCDPAHPFYGDKHVGFDLEEAELNAERLQAIYDKYQEIYSDKTILLAIEYLCRSENCFEEFEKQMSLFPWEYATKEILL